MIELNILKLYEHLAELNEAKVDIDNFINKFGEDTYELFKKSTQRLKNKGISTDLNYHVKYTTKKDLDTILINLQNRTITKDGSLTELDGDYEYLGQGKGYKVYKINDVIASINLGSDTGWCISGRYGHYGEKNYTPSKIEAEKHWKDYTKQGAQFYFFISNKDKAALAIYPKVINLDKLDEWGDAEEGNELNRIVDNTYLEKTNCEIYTEQDKLDYSLFSSLPINLVDQTVVVEGHPLKNGLYIKDNNLIKCVDKNLENVVIPNGVTSIGNDAFKYHFNLKSIILPNSVKSIGDNAFKECESLKSINVPHSITSIGEAAFDGCSNLTDITIPNSVTKIGKFAFCGCCSLTSVTIPHSVTSIGENAFRYCDSLTSITIPNSVKSIDKGTFAECYSLTNITIPDSVTSIDGFAFYNCISLTSITIGKNVRSIRRAAFRNCKILKSIVIPDSVTSIDDYAFDGCESLTNITVDKNNSNYKVVDGHLYDKDDKMIV